MDLNDVIQTNKRIANMLKNCPEETLEKWKITHYPKHKIICHQGEVYDRFYIIVDGLASIFIMAENGKKYIQSIYKKGDYFGELEIFNSHPYICSIEALTELTVMSLEKSHFLNWIKKDKDFLLYLTRTLCNSFYKLSQKAGEDLLYSLKYRICNHLMFCVEKGEKKPFGIKVKIPKKQLSQLLVVTPRSINRILKQLEQREIIEVYNDSIIVKDVERLKEEEVKSRFE